jgi:hypothetical protein
VVINGRVVEPTPGQAARLAVVEAQARDATQRVQQYDRKWSPSAETYENVEALISAYQSQAQEARARLRELQQLGVGPGPFARESIPAGRSVTASDRIELKRMFDQYGCHTCGTFEPGTVSGNPVGDHQPSSAFYWLRSERRLYPQCLYCSLRHGGVVNGLLRR